MNPSSSSPCLFAGMALAAAIALPACSGSESTGGGGGAAVACSPDGAAEYCYPGPPTAGGVGECHRGMRICSLGVWSPCAGYGLPTDEICGDFLDNDCDGSIDEGCACETGTVQACYSGPASTRGVPVCHDGEQRCVDALWDSDCVGEVLPAADEPCNELDDDCNGIVDDGCACTEGATMECYGGSDESKNRGECRAGTQSCVGGVWSTTCVGEVLPSPEVCNGRDDDCDGATDEALGETTCGLGPCEHTVPNCQDGEPETCDPMQGASAETCDGIDNDCDGQPDEGCSCVNGTTQPCYTGQQGTQNNPPCHSGTQSCSNGSWGSCTGQVTPIAETCNGIDDDCDGTADDNLGSTSCGVGPCAHSQINCVSGQPQVCNPYLGATSETCNNVDDDCDGTVDDGNPGGGASCNTGQLGVCAAGTITCQSGSLNCVRNQGPTSESCNNLDDDCDGAVDDGTNLQLCGATDYECVSGSCYYIGTCPYLYTWDGTHFGFEAEVHTSGKLGVLTSTGWARPQPNDYLVLAHEPALRDGSLELRLVEERHEVDYTDLVELVAADVPAGLAVYAERYGLNSAYEPIEIALHTVDEMLTPPLSAVHLSTGESVLEEISATDGVFAVLNNDRNLDYVYQTIEIDLGDVSGAPQVKLVIDGRTAFPNSPAGIERKALFGPHSRIQVMDTGGQWVNVPSSLAVLSPPPEARRPFVVDITNIFRTNDYRVRLTYLFKTYLDGIYVDTTPDVAPVLTPTTLESADLHFYGHSQKVGDEVFEYVYGSVSQQSWPAFPGFYTRYGDVTELLTARDDKFVIYWGGDEVTMRFAPWPAPAPSGMSRFVVVHGWGYYKEPSCSVPYTVEPLPFAAMSGYPYDLLAEHYPNDPDHVAYRQSYNTRWLP